MAEHLRDSEKPKEHFLKRLFFVTAGLFAAGVIAIEIVPKLLHILGYEVVTTQASGEVSHEALRRSVLQAL